MVALSRDDVRITRLRAIEPHRNETLMVVGRVRGMLPSQHTCRP
jgi:hypothetical protein